MSELKYVIFFGVLLFGVPVGILLCKMFRPFEKFIFFLTIFFTCRMNETINFISYEWYRGTSRGFEIALVDLAVLILFIFVFIRDNKVKKIAIIPPGSILFGLFFFFSCVSIVNSAEALYSFFEVGKLIRMYFYYWTVHNYIDSDEKLKDLIRNIAIVVGYIFLVVLYDKYILGMFQAKGPFPHQNSLVMYSIIFGNIIFSKFLNSKGRWYAFYGLLTGMIAVVIVSTLSRAGMVFFAASLGMTFMITSIRTPRIKHAFTAFLGVLAAFGLLLKAGDSIIERFETAPKESSEVRIMLAQAAVKMANAKTFGVGLNNFGLKINYPYPYSKGTPHYYDPEFRGGLVETAYLMVAAETGWHNLVIYLMFLWSFFIRNLINIFRSKVYEHQIFSFALFGGLFGIYVESTLEWVLRQTTNFYQLMLVFAVISSIQQLRRRSKVRQNKIVSLSSTEKVSTENCS